MKTLDKGKDKIDKICAVLRDETLEPAQKEAQQIIEKAQQKAEQIVLDAQKAAEKLHANVKAAIEKEDAAFQASLVQASRQALEVLRQSVEDKFFNHNLLAIIEKSAADPQLIANLINAIVQALQKEGMAVDLTALVPKTVTAKQINHLLLQEVLQSLKEKSVVPGEFAAGAKVKLHDRRMTIDISEQALKELLNTYINRKDFRKLIFAT